jgi:hypothetical protein
MPCGQNGNMRDMGLSIRMLPNDTIPVKALDADDKGISQQRLKTQSIGTSSSSVRDHKQWEQEPKNFGRETAYRRYRKPAINNVVRHMLVQ